MQSTPLQRVQEYCAGESARTESPKYCPLELLDDIKVLDSRAAELRRMGFENVELSPFLKLKLLGQT